MVGLRGIVPVSEDRVDGSLGMKPVNIPSAPLEVGFCLTHGARQGRGVTGLRKGTVPGWWAGSRPQGPTHTVPSQY